MTAAFMILAALLVAGGMLIAYAWWSRPEYADPDQPGFVDVATTYRPAPGWPCWLRLPCRRWTPPRDPAVRRLQAGLRQMRTTRDIAGTDL